MSAHNSGTGATRDSGYGSGVSGNSNTHDNPSSTNHGPHSSNLLNKLDPRVDSDNSKAATGHSGTGSSGITGGTHTSHGGAGTSQYNDPHSTTAGPHSSNVANKADPRVDSDRDNRGATGGLGGSGVGHSTGTHGTSGAFGGPGAGHSTGTHGTTGGLGGSGVGHSTGTHGTTGGLGGSGVGHSTGTHNTSSANAGPHGSSLANKADPRVDSDRDNSHNAGYGSGTSTGAGLGSTTGPGHHTTGGTGYGGSGSTTAGPHDSNLANKADPRVDSDRDGSRNVGSGTGTGYGTAGSHGTHGPTGTTGTTGTSHENHPSSTNAGPHSSNIANKLDPRVDSDHDNRTNVGSNTGTENPAISSHAEGHGHSSGGGGGLFSSGKHNDSPSNATANASVVGGTHGQGAGNSSLPPEGQASASGPSYASAETSTNPIKKTIDKLTGKN